MIRLIHSNKKIFLLVLLMVLLFCGQGWATNYYFADSGSGGSDANPCSSATCTNSASPCETIECVNEVLDDLGSGTHAIYFNKGNTFVISDADKRLGFRNTSSAAIDYPATVNLIFDQYDKDSYPGSGDPNIYSTVSCSLYNYAMFVINDTDVGNVTIQNLSFSGEGGNIACQGVNLDNVSGNVDFNNNTIDFNGSNDTANALDAMVAFRYRWYSSTNGNITVHDNTIYDITSSGSPEADKDGIGIRLGCDSCDLKTSGTVDIYNNTVYGVNSDCIQVQSVLLSGSTLNIYNNTLYNFGENAIDLKGSSNTAIYHNVMYRGNWAQGGESRGGTLTWSAVANGDDAIYENYFGENDKTGAIYAMNYTAGRTLSVYRNYFYDTITAVSMEEGILKFYNNVYYNTKGQDGRSSVGGTPVGTNAAMWFNDTSSGMESGTAIINNTFWAQPAASPTGRSHDDVIMIYEGTVDLQNNIFYLDFDDSDAYPVDCYSGSSKTITLDNNVYFNNQNSNTIDTSSCGAISDSNAVTTIPGWSTFPEVANGGNLHNQGDNTVGATYDDAIFWPGSTWTPAASIDVWTYDQDLVGVGWEIGAVVYGGGDTYYVNCDAGSSGDGSYGSPWNSLEDVESAGLNGGDDVYIYEGSTCTYNNPSGANFTMNWEGVDSNNHAIIGCYKDGPTMCSPGEFAIVDGSKTDWSTYGCPETTACDEEDEGTCVWYSLFRISGSYITISNLEIKNACGTLLVHTDNAAETDVHIEYNKLHDAGKNAILTYDSGSWFPCCSDGCGPSARTDFLIQYNEAYGTDKVHKYGPGGGFLSLWQQVFGLVVANSVIQYNYIHDAGGEGIMMRSKNTEPGNIVQYNHIRDVNPCAICIYRGQDHIIRYNLIVGDQSSVTYEGQGGGGRNWSEGILFLAHHTDTNGIQDIYVYGNIVMGCKMGVGFNLGGDHYTCGEPWARDEALTAYIYNNQFIDNYGNVYGFWNLGAGDDPSNTTIVYKNNISYHYGTGTEVLYWPASDKPTVTASNNLWESLPTGNASDFATNGYTGNPYIGVPSGDTDWQQIEATSDYTTEDTNIAANSNAIGKGTDLGGAGDCSSTISHNCGLSLTTDDVDFHDLPNTATFDLVDQGDNAVEIGPWVYTEDDQELPPNKGSFGLGARIQSN